MDSGIKISMDILDKLVEKKIISKYEVLSLCYDKASIRFYFYINNIQHFIYADRVELDFLKSDKFTDFLISEMGIVYKKYLRGLDEIILKH